MYSSFSQRAVKRQSARSASASAITSTRPISSNVSSPSASCLLQQLHFSLPVSSQRLSAACKYCDDTNRRSTTTFREIRSLLSPPLSEVCFRPCFSLCLPPSRITRKFCMRITKTFEKGRLGDEYRWLNFGVITCRIAYRIEASPVNDHPRKSIGQKAPKSLLCSLCGLDYLKLFKLCD